MKISCYLWLACLLISIFGRDTVWCSANKQFNTNHKPFYTKAENKYESYEDFSSSNVKSRNERETNSYEAEENENYDNSVDMYPSLNLFSWWSSKDRDKGSKSDIKCTAIFNNNTSDSNSGSKNTYGISSSCISLVSDSDTSSTSMNVSSNLMSNLSTTVHTSTKGWHLFHRTHASTENVNKTSGDDNIVNHGLKPELNFSISNLAKENYDSSTSIIHCTKEMKVYTFHEGIQQENLTTLSPLVYPLSTVTINMPTASLAENRPQEPNLGKFHVTSATMKPTFQLISINPTISRRTTNAGIKTVLGPLSNEPSSKIPSIYSNNLLFEQPNPSSYPESNFAKQVKLSSTSKKHDLIPTSIKSVFRNITRQLHLNKGTTIPYPFNIYTQHLYPTKQPFLITNLTSRTKMAEEHTPLIMQFGFSLSTNKAFSGSTPVPQDDPFSFLQPIPTLQVDSSKKNLEMNFEKSMNRASPVESENNTNNNLDLLKSNKSIDANEGSNSQTDAKHKEMKFVFPEYLSGLREEVFCNNTNVRKKRTSKNITSNKNEKQFNKHLTQFENLFTDEASETFNTKFRNLQNDLADLQKAIVSQTKENSEKNMTVHIRVIVDLVNNTDELNDHEINDSNVTYVASDLAVSAKETDSNHSLIKRSWLFQKHHQQNQSQLLEDKILNGSTYNEVNQKAMEKKIGETYDNENDDLKVKLKSLASVLNDDLILSTSSTTINKEKDPKCLLTSQIDPIETKIGNPFHKTIYYRYITGQKYLVIPLEYLEQQKTTNNNTYNILRPNSIYLKNFESDSVTGKPPDIIAKYLNNDRDANINKHIGYTDEVISTKNQENFINDPKNHLDTKSSKQTKISNGKIATLLVGEPEMTFQFLLHHNNQNIKTKNSKFGKNQLVVNKNGAYKKPFNQLSSAISSNTKNDVKQKNSRVTCVRYPVFDVGNYSSLLSNNNVKEIVLKSRRESDKSLQPFLFFTNVMNGINDFSTEASFIASKTGKSNIISLIGCHNCNEFNLHRKPNISENLKTCKVDLIQNKDINKKYNWENLIFSDNVIREGNFQHCKSVLPSDTQSSLLFASKFYTKRDSERKKNLNSMNCKKKLHYVRNKRKVRKNYNNQQSKKYSKRVFSKKNSSKSKKCKTHASLDILEPKTKLKKNEVNYQLTTEYESNCNAGNRDETGEFVVDSKNNPKYFSLTTTSTTLTTKILTNVKNIGEHAIKGRLQALGRGLQSAIVTKALQALTTTQTTAVTKSVQPRNTTKITSSSTTPTANTKGENKNEECNEPEEICSGIPPTTLVSRISANSTFKTSTDKIKGTGGVPPRDVSTPTPSEEEIENACTECLSCCLTTVPICGAGKPTKAGGGGSKHPTDEYHGHTSIKPRGVQCHHHLKNHTTLEHHKMKDFPGHEKKGVKT